MVDPRRVMLIDDDRDLATILRAILVDERYLVSVLATVVPPAVRAAVDAEEPDCVLLDGEGSVGFGASWDVASWLRERERPIPTVMFTADALAVREARALRTARSLAAGFSRILPKPFGIDELLDAVLEAVSRSAPLDRAAASQGPNTPTLDDQLRAAGATDVRTSQRRQWAEFRTPSGVHAQLYWSQAEEVYHLTLTDPSGRRLRPYGQFREVAAALAIVADG